MKLKVFFSQFGQTIKKSSIAFIDDNAIKLSASLSYYTIFSLPPVLMIIIFLCSFFFGKNAVQGEIYWEIQGLVGQEAAKQIQELIKHVQLSSNTFFATVISVITFLFSSTGVFTEIQDSVNYIWGLKAKPRKEWMKIIVNRLLSFCMIIS